MMRRKKRKPCRVDSPIALFMFHQYYKLRVGVRANYSACSIIMRAEVLQSFDSLNVQEIVVQSWIQVQCPYYT